MTTPCLDEAGVVFTTCEVVLGSIRGVNFEREHDVRTGYKELIPRQILNDESWFGVQNIAKLAMLVGIGYSLGVLSKTSRS